MSIAEEGVFKVSSSSNPFLLPARKKIISGQSGFEQKPFKEWINDLPVGNVGLTAHLLYDKLIEMNQVDISPTERMRALEMMLESFKFIFGALTKGLVREPLPLSKRSMRVADLVAKLYVLVIQAYKAVLDQFHNDSLAGKVLHKGSRAEALHRLLYFLGQAQLNAYRLYQSPPKHIWQEIHGIYHYAVESKLHDKLLENEGEGEVRKSTVTDLYKQILLLSLAGPYRLQVGEVGKVYHALQRWVSKVRLINVAMAEPGDGLFLVDITSDNPPKYRVMQGDEIIRIGWVLDTSGLAEALAAEHDQLVKSTADKQKQHALNHPLAVSAELLSHLMLCWGVGPQRTDKRFSTSGSVSLACGIESLYTLLGGKALPEIAKAGYQVGTLESGRDKAVTHEPISRSRLQSDEYLVEGSSELMAFIKQQAEGSEGVDSHQPAPAESPQIIDDVEELQGLCLKRCKILDASANGYHLVWDGENDTRAHVGELVGVRREDGDGRFHVGVIRWLKSADQQAMEIGIELFRGVMKPIVIHRKKVLENRVDNMCGFFYHAGQQAADTILVPLFYAGNDDQIFIEMNHEEIPVVLGRTLESSASFVQFQFQMERSQEEQDDEGAVADATGKSADDAFDFEDIWSELK